MTTLPSFFAGPATDHRRIAFDTENGANTLAAKIEAAWRKVGNFKVKAWGERRPRRENGDEKYFYDVRTNLVGGLPPIDRR